MTEYRIITNGDKYRIQYKKKRWFSKKYKWVLLKVVLGPMGATEVYETEFEKVAEQLVEKRMHEEFYDTQPWRIHKDYGKEARNRL